MATYKSTADFLKVQLRNFKDATDRNKVLRSAVVQSVAPIIDRIQQQGEKSDGSQIGKYGDRVIKSAFGKAKTFASKKRLKTVTGEDSYKILRQKLGLQVAYIDFTFSGDMFKAFKPFPAGTNAYSVGFTSDEQFKKAANLEKKFGITFDQTREEEAATIAEITKTATMLLSR